MSEKTTQALRSLRSLRLNRSAKNWKQPKQLSITTLPFGRSLNGHGRTSASLRLRASALKRCGAARRGRLALPCGFAHWAQMPYCDKPTRTNNKQEESK